MLGVCGFFFDGRGSRQEKKEDHEIDNKQLNNPGREPQQGMFGELGGMGKFPGVKP